MFINNSQRYNFNNFKWPVRLNSTGKTALCHYRPLVYITNILIIQPAQQSEDLLTKLRSYRQETYRNVWNPQVIYRLHKRQSLAPTLSQTNSVHTHSHPPALRPILIIFSHLRLALPTLQVFQQNLCPVHGLYMQVHTYIYVFASDLRTSDIKKTGICALWAPSRKATKLTGVRRRRACRSYNANFSWIWDYTFINVAKCRYEVQTDYFSYICSDTLLRSATEFITAIL